MQKRFPASCSCLMKSQNPGQMSKPYASFFPLDERVGVEQKGHQDVNSKCFASFLRVSTPATPSMSQASR